MSISYTSQIEILTFPSIVNVRRKEYRDSDHSAWQTKVKFLTEKEEIRRLYCWRLNCNLGRSPSACSKWKLVFSFPYTGCWLVKLRMECRAGWKPLALKQQAQEWQKTGRKWAPPIPVNHSKVSSDEALVTVGEVNCSRCCFWKLQLMMLLGQWHFFPLFFRQDISQTLNEEEVH